MTVQYGLVLYLHVLLFVFWLGTDLGVFVCSRRLQKPDLSLETRSTLLQVAMLLDRLPRSCFALIVPVGFQLMSGLGVLPFPTSWLVPIWVLCIVWLVALWTGFLREGTPLANLMRMTDKCFQVAVLLGVGGLGLISLLTGGPVEADWLAIKLLIMGLIAATAIMIDVAFTPFVAAFGRLVSEGSTAAIESSISRSLNHAYLWVIATYALVAAAAYLGTTKLL